MEWCWYGVNRVCAALYDLQMRLGARWIELRRQSLVGAVGGRTLELGIGTGQNARFYPPAAHVVGVDPEPAMLARAQPRVAAAPATIHLVAGVGEALPVPDASFDEAVAALVFCSVDDPATTLAEIRRVLKPGGRLRFFEHVRSDTPHWAGFQDLVTPLWSKVASG
jgi:ubiquinone/menaquinone biosynthesis C-methylase UbiE